MVRGSHHNRKSKERIRQARIGTSHSYETRVKMAKTTARKLERLAGRYRSPAGHIECLYNGFSKYQPGWKVPIDPCRDIISQFVTDPEYVRLFKEWEESNYNPLLSPVLMRKVKKLGFTIDNLEPKIKNSYSWWNEDSVLLKCLQAEMEDGQVSLQKENKPKEDKIRNQAKQRKFKK